MVNGLLRGAGLRLVSEYSHCSLEKRAVDLERLLELHTRWQKSPDEPCELGCLIFSKDRAIQLDALLRSLMLLCNPRPLVSVLYATTTDAHQNAYDELQKAHESNKIAWHKQSDFQAQCRQIIQNTTSKALMFLVDDIVFIKPCDLGRLLTCDLRRCIPSLRMGCNLNYSYMRKQAQELPPFLESGSDLRFWLWEDGKLDWRYPLSLDGHVFWSDEMKVLVDAISFKAPNSLELALQKFVPFFLSRAGVCFEQSRVVNILANRVQKEINNPQGATTAEALLKKWQDGFRIDLERLYGVNNTSVHMELPFTFEKR